ncbi:phosphoribosylpyrophosphate synthetase [Portibacter marinus]|uniref:phosphoribosylpyrophosphate synthetase n=1 Tax=Portibacter marinus TaxID=2898660 RepID=UPI001F1A7756|nr:phosphoribosylpyrophosphate synthetase [Portibacter marinus]
MDQNNYDTLSEAIEDLKDKGYVEDFNIKSDCIKCERLDRKLSPAEFNVDQMYRFEGMSSTDDNSVLYAISSEKHDLKGLLVDAYGVYADPMTMEMIQKLKYDPRK